MSRSAWYRAIDGGPLVLVHPGVARVRGAPVTFEQRVAAAVLALSPHALASHRSAARLWGLARPDTDPIDVIVPRNGPRPDLDGVVVHRPCDRHDLAPSSRAGIRVTNPLRMLCDLASVDPQAVGGAVEHVVVAGYARPTGLRRLVDRHATQGRAGIDALRHAVAAWPLGEKPADSVLEAAMARLLSAHRLPSAEFHAIVEGFEVDFLIRGTPVVIECDGWEFHVSSRAQWVRDTDRDAVLSAAGYVTLRRTWDHIIRHEAATVARIEAVLRRWAPDVLAEARSRSRPSRKPGRS
jgi:very-short-patch-repair endonuclease